MVTIKINLMTTWTLCFGCLLMTPAFSQVPSPPLVPYLPSYVSQIGLATAQDHNLIDVTDNEALRGMQTDRKGNVYFCGSTQGSLNEANGGPPPNADLFVGKYDKDGRLDWLKQLGADTMLTQVNTPNGLTFPDATGTEECAALDIDRNGHIVVAGLTNGSFVETSGGSSDVLLAKFESDGTVIWVSQLGNTSMPIGTDYGDVVAAMTLDANGNIYLTGSTEGELVDSNPNHAEDVFVAKFDTFGKKQWVNQIGMVTAATLPLGGSSFGLDSGKSIAINSVGDIIVVGQTRSSLAEINAGLEDIFVASFDGQTGNLNTGFGDGGVKQIITSMWGPTVASDRARSMVLDDNDDIYFSGYTSGDLGEPNAGSFDVFVGKLLASGQTVAWFAQVGSVTAPMIPFLSGSATGGDASNLEAVWPGNSLAMLRSGDLVLTGFTRSSLGETNANGSSDDIFLARFDGFNGALKWLRQVGQDTQNAVADVMVASFDESAVVIRNTKTNIYVMGTSNGSLGENTALPGQRDDIIALRFSNDGKLQ